MSKETVKKMGLFSVVLFGINGIVGTGIFGMPNKAYSLVGEQALIAIVFCAVVAFIVGLCFAEASARFKENGGPYLYAREAFGDFVGYEVGMMKWAMGFIAWSALASFFAQRMGTTFPTLASEGAQAGIIIVTIVGLCIINLMGIKASKTVNNVITISKLTPLVLICVVGVFMFGSLEAPVVEGAKVIEPTTGLFFEAVILLFFAFTGFESLPIIAGEMENAKKNMPRALMIVLAFVSVIYLIIMAVSMEALGTGLATSKTPVADAAGVLMGDFGKSLVVTGTLISVLGINIAAAYFTPISAVAIAENGLLPEVFTKKNSKGAPYMAIILSGVLAIGLALSGSFATLAAIGTVVRFVCQYIPTSAAVLVLRKKYPNQKMSYMTPFGSLVPVLSIVLSIIIMGYVGFSAPDKILKGCIGLLIVAPFYLVVKERIKKLSEERKARGDMD